MLPSMKTMSISDYPARVLSCVLVLALAMAAGGWARADRGTLRTCHQQEHSCTPVASLTCCCHGDLDPTDPARLPPTAPLVLSACPLSLMVILPTASQQSAPTLDITSRHWHQCLDLRILHSTFLI
jgi:hypothetical protein